MGIMMWSSLRSTKTWWWDTVIPAAGTCLSPLLLPLPIPSSHLHFLSFTFFLHSPN